MLSLSDNLFEVRKNIEDACRRAGRNPDSVTLIAVSKTKPAEDIEEIYNAGVREFGENKVQEMTEKLRLLPKDINWHMIGHLQRNKVKYVVGTAVMIHSVDSLRLAREISDESVKKNITSEILIEVNVANETSKFGVTVEEAYDLVSQIGRLPNILIRGLMTSAPFVENAEENRQYFKKLRDLSVDINSKNIDNVYMDCLSMGMTNDYVVAVEEGATHVRVGTAIFGHRNYNI